MGTDADDVDYSVSIVGEVLSEGGVGSIAINHDSSEQDIRRNKFSESGLDVDGTGVEVGHKGSGNGDSSGIASEGSGNSVENVCG